MEYEVGVYDIKLDKKKRQYIVKRKDGLDLVDINTTLLSSFEQDPGVLGTKILKLEDTMFHVKNRITIVFGETKFTQDEREYIAYNFLRIGFMYIVMNDDFITEIFVSNVESPLMIEHKEGRLITNIFPQKENLELFIDRLATDTNSIINKNIPVIKASFVLSGYKCRANMELDPLAPDGPLGNIRKLPEKPYELSLLISYKMITPEMAKLFEILIKKLHNILVLGLPNAGKTTLALAISNLLAPHVRRISVEDVEELPKDIRTSRTFVPPIGSSNKYTTKQKEIIRLLHKTPDWVFLGELQDKSHVLAFLEFLSIGLSGVETTHGASYDNLVQRWVGRFEIPPVFFSNIGWVILVENTYSEGNIDDAPFRHVTKIYRILSKKKKCPILSTIPKQYKDKLSKYIEIKYWEDLLEWGKG